MKLVIIGGGSAYTPDIIAGLLREQQVFQGWELALHDIDPFNLQVIARLARGMVRTAGVDMAITATTDRTQALSDARFVLTQPRVGGLKARALDERIPLKHGVIGQETLGPGGMAFAWRTIPVILDLVAEVQRVAPQAWIINYANPAGMVTEAVVRRFPGARFIGLCDMPTGIEWAIGKLMRVNFHRIALDYAGINHGGWSGRVLLDGENILPRLLRWGRVLRPMAKLLPLGEETATVRLFQQMGLMPDPYLRYYYFTEQIRRKLQRQRKTRAEVLMVHLPTLYRHYEAVSMTDRPVLSLHRGHQSHSDLASQVIASMASGRRTRFVIQQRNGGAVPNLPANEAAQFPAWVDANGWEPIKLDPLPEQLVGLLQRIKSAESLNVDATLSGNVAMAIEAAAANPLVPNRKTAETIVRELLRAHKSYAPQFQ